MTKDALFSVLSDKNRDLSFSSGRTYGDKGRLLSAAEKFVSCFPDDEEIRLFSSPGRTEIGGNHTDHNGGRVLAAAVDADIIAAASPRMDGEIRIFSEGFGFIHAKVEITEPDEALFGSSEALVQGVSSVLASRGFTVGGFDACIESRVLPGSGLSSSAAFELLIAEIQNAFFNKGKIDALTLAIASQEAENRYFGKPCGLMDQTACASGGFVGIDFIDPSKPLVTPVDFDFEKSGLALIITDTRASHAGLTPHYAAIPAEMKAVAAFFGKPVLRGLTREELLASVPALRQKVSDRAILRAMHFISEDERATRQFEALKAGDTAEFLRLVRESGASSRNLLQNITAPESNSQSVALALAVSDAVLGGEGASRVHGGGFAGTVQAFVPIYLKGGYCAAMNRIFGEGSAVCLGIRRDGADEIS